MIRASLCQLAPHGLVWSTTCHTLRVVVTPSMPHRCALCHACGPNIPIEYSVRATASELLRFPPTTPDLCKLSRDSCGRGAVHTGGMIVPYRIRIRSTIMRRSNDDQI